MTKTLTLASNTIMPQIWVYANKLHMLCSLDMSFTSVTYYMGHGDYYGLDESELLKARLSSPYPRSTSILHSDRLPESIQILCSYRYKYHYHVFQ